MFVSPLTLPKHYVWVFFAACLILSGCNGGGDSPATQNDNCRCYATRYFASGEAITNGYPDIETPIEAFCHFDPDTLILECYADYYDQYNEASRITRIFQYDSIEDFVAEGNLPGRIRALTHDVSNTGFSNNWIVARPFDVGVYVYDDNKRPIALDDIQFTQWDDRGRPLAMEPTSICTEDQGKRFTYNDENNTVRIDFNSRTSTPGPNYPEIPCIPNHYEIHFDHDGNVIETIINDGLSATYDIAETDCICY